jgi:hypothetical protein
MRAGEPVGQRQQYKAGKVWPPVPRVAGEPLPWLHRYYAAHYWPYPYNELDRMSVHTIVGAHIASGWQSSCTLYEYHFEPETHALNSSGRTKLQWILLNVPAEHRQAFVAASADTDTNARRLAEVQSALSGLIGRDNSMPVALRMASPHGRPAGEVEEIFEYRMEKMLPPAIEYTSVGTAASN